MEYLTSLVYKEDKAECDPESASVVDEEIEQARAKQISSFATAVVKKKKGKRRPGSTSATPSIVVNKDDSFAVVVRPRKKGSFRGSASSQRGIVCTGNFTQNRRFFKNSAQTAKTQIQFRKTQLFGYICIFLCYQISTRKNPST